ncbi:MAG: hypothetical protein M1820_010239 [Bogoriella megaspora]|nr:MAG: hypothetical protein M1820_010239 [Bogoriella megaspora]
MLSFLAAKPPPRTKTAHQNPVTLADSNSRSAFQFYPADAPYSVKQWCPPGSRIMNPLLHIHHSQDEYFNIESGTGIWHMPNHNDPLKRRITISASEAKTEEERKVLVPLGEYHTFEAIGDEVLVIEAKYDGPDYETEERFFRNFFCYLNDCAKAGVPPSIYQLNTFLYDFKCPPAVSVPGPQWVKYWSTCFMCWWKGRVIGQFMLGYKNSYPEYYAGKPSEDKSQQVIWTSRYGSFDLV